MPTDLMQFLARVPLFHGLNERTKKQLAKRFVTRTFQPNEAIVTQGKGGTGLFTIVSGRAEAVVESADGIKTVVNSFHPTDFFGEITLLDDGPRTASVMATEETDCLVLNRLEFLAVMKNDADMGVIIAQELAKQLRRTIDAMA